MESVIKIVLNVEDIAANGKVILSFYFLVSNKYTKTQLENDIMDTL